MRDTKQKTGLPPSEWTAKLFANAFEIESGRHDQPAAALTLYKQFAAHIDGVGREWLINACKKWAAEEEKKQRPQLAENIRACLLVWAADALAVSGRDHLKGSPSKILSRLSI